METVPSWFQDSILKIFPRFCFYVDYQGKAAAEISCRQIHQRQTILGLTYKDRRSIDQKPSAPFRLTSLQMPTESRNLLRFGLESHRQYFLMQTPDQPSHCLGFWLPMWTGTWRRWWLWGEEGLLLRKSAPCPDAMLCFSFTVLFLTQRRMHISESLRFNVAKGLAQALRKAFHQNDVSAHVSPLLLWSV